MRRMLKLISVLLSAGLLLTACVPKSEEPELDGGTKNNTNRNAPKVIESTEIVAFRCEFSAMGLTEGESELAGTGYVLTAGLVDGAVKGSYGFWTSDQQRGRFSFQAEPAFLDQLQKLVAKHDLPQYNGISIHTYGIPDQDGAELSIDYASGESVYASDNRGGILPLAAMEDLVGLFRQQVEPEVEPEAAPTDGAEPRSQS